jgi:GT2 family glycosyltransferase/glycosyltransferase involved in cell wall biosynthesis
MEVDDLIEAARLIGESGFFEESWYLQQYPDVAQVGLDPISHYIRVGWHLGRNPGRGFDAAWYLARYEDVKASGQNPLLHYVCHGRVEGREIRGMQVGDDPERKAPAIERGRVIRRQWIPGKRRHAATMPNLLLCAHVSGQHLFGAERSFIDVLDALANLGFNVVVTLPGTGNREYLEEVRARCMGVHELGYPQWFGDRAPDEGLVLVFADIIAMHAIEVVHANTIMLLEPLLAARRMGRHAVVHARELVSRDTSLCERIGLPAPEIVRRVLERSDHVIANSHATAVEFHRDGRTHLVPNAVDTSALDLPNALTGKVRFALVSSNVAKKGCADFIDVACHCSDKADNAEFLLIGPETEQVSEWRAAQVRGELPGCIRFVGYLDSPREAMAEANVVLNLSNFAESFGRTVAEAAAARRPVIAYDWGAVSDLIEDGTTGYLVPYRDVAAVAGRVLGFCRDPASIAPMGERGRARMLAGFGQAQLRDNLGNAYEAILGRPLRTNTTLANAGDLQRNGGTEAVHPGSAETPAPGLSIVIPVYGAIDAVRECVASVLRHTDPATAKVLLIDDCSPGADMGPMLEMFASTPGVTVLRNASNLGYTRTVNLGLRHTGDDDVILLNSDTIVTPQWVEGLRSTAYSQPRVGTVTAMSDNAGAFSFPWPDRTNPKPPEVGHDDYAATLVTALAGLAPVDLPTGSGFCMYLRRALISQIGLFDEAAFPRGYGEENDLCQRALNAGWRNLLTPHAFVFHVRSASFGAERESLARQGLDVVLARYPDYLRDVGAAFSSTPMCSLRQAVQEVVAGIVGPSAGVRRLQSRHNWQSGESVDRQ